jgi:hypothetical protein
MDLIAKEKIREDLKTIGIYHQYEFDALFNYIKQLSSEVVTETIVNQLDPQFGSFWSSKQWKETQKQMISKNILVEEEQEITFCTGKSIT